MDLRQVERLADLSHLSLGPPEAERMRCELSSILGYFATLDKAEVSEDAAPQRTLQEGVAPRSAHT